MDNLKSAITSLSARELRVLRERFGLQVEAEQSIELGDLIPPNDDEGNQGGAPASAMQPLEIKPK